MTQKIRPSDITLIDLETHFNLQLVEERTFFPE